MKIPIKNKPIIWYLHHYAGSPSLGMSLRPYYLSSEFNKNQYLSFVIGSSFHHLKKNSKDQIKPIEAQTINGEPYIWLKTPTYKGNGFARVKNMLTYAWSLWRQRNELIKLTGTPSVIIVSSAHPLHYLSAFLIKKKLTQKLFSKFETYGLYHSPSY